MTTPLIHLAGDTARARTGNPETSHAAADRSSKKLSELQSIVYGLLLTAPDFGLTDSELDDRYANGRDRFNWPAVRHETPRKRRSDLVRLGLVEDSGIRRLNKFDGFEVVWIAVTPE